MWQSPRARHTDALAPLRGRARPLVPLARRQPPLQAVRPAPVQGGPLLPAHRVIVSLRRKVRRKQDCGLGLTF